ncbi:hypothetical protein Tco_0836969 [Tanacetum coccineum]
MTMTASNLNETYSRPLLPYLYLTEQNSDEHAKIGLSGELIMKLRDNAYDGAETNDAVDHTTRFLQTIDLVKTPNLNIEQLYVLTFQYSLTGKAQQWWMHEENFEITSWVEIVDKFFYKYYPLSRTSKTNDPNEKGYDNDTLDYDEESSDDEYSNGDSHPFFDQHQNDNDKSDENDKCNDHSNGPENFVRTDAPQSSNDKPNEGMCRMGKFEVIKYSVGDNEEFLGARALEHNSWAQNVNRVSSIYLDIFRKKDEGNYEVTCKEEAKRRNSGTKTKTFEESTKTASIRYTSASQVNVSHNLTKPVTLHSWPQMKESYLANPNDVIALGPTRNRPNHVSLQSPREYGKPSMITPARLPNTANGCKPNPRNWQASMSSRVSNKYVYIGEHRKQKPSLKSNDLQCPTCKKCLYSVNHDECVLKYLSKLNSSASAQNKDAQCLKITKRYMPVRKTMESKKHDKQIPIGQNFSPNKSFNVYLKTTPPRSGLRWKPTGIIFSNFCLRWIPTGKLFNSCTGKVDSERTHGSNVDISHIHACKQYLDLSARKSQSVVAEKADITETSAIVVSQMMKFPSNDV